MDPEPHNCNKAVCKNDIKIEFKIVLGPKNVAPIVFNLVKILLWVFDAFNRIYGCALERGASERDILRLHMPRSVLVMTIFIYYALT